MLAGAFAGALLTLKTPVGVTLAITTAVPAVATGGYAFAFRPLPATHLSDET